jgi:hypothetical protein
MFDFIIIVKGGSKLPHSKGFASSILETRFFRHFATETSYEKDFVSGSFHKPFFIFLYCRFCKLSQIGFWLVRRRPFGRMISTQQHFPEEAPDAGLFLNRRHENPVICDPGPL